MVDNNELYQRIFDLESERDELKAEIDELMRQYADEEIDGATYTEKMMELTTSVRDENDD